MSKPKKPIRSREQLLIDLKKNDNFLRKMKFAREIFLPAVEKACPNVDDAKMFLSSINNVIMERFLQKMKESKVSDLKLIEGLDEKSEHYDGYKAILELFNDMTVFDAKDNIEGMKSEIDLWINEEMKGRTLTSLPKRWLDEI